MRVVIGVVVGAVLMWLFESERARDEARRRLEQAPDWLHRAGRTAASTATTGVQRVAEAVDAAPLPPNVKSTASDAAFNLWAAGEALTQESPEGANRGSAGGEATT